MELKHINREISLLTTMEATNYISEYGLEKLKEFRYLKGLHEEKVKNCSIPDVGSSLPKVCKGCGTLSTKVIDKKYLACCPDNNYIPMEEYCKKAIYPDKQF